jgi:glycerol-3-phosphate dehydrogenase
MVDFDVAVIGAGLIGSAIARELAGQRVNAIEPGPSRGAERLSASADRLSGSADRLRVVVVEGRSDVGDGTSKANTAILHTGFDAQPGTLESRLVKRGAELLSAYAKQVGIPVERTGALLVAWTEEELQTLPRLRAKAEQNGYQYCELVDAGEVYRQVPALGPGALGGITVPDESITCTWTTTLALATEARLRGAELRLSHKVQRISRTEASTTLHTDGGDVRARWVVNAAGLGADLIDGMFGHHRFTVTPRRGELLVFDKLARPLVNRIVLPVPSKVGKGVLISPTIYGNVMLGPTAEDLTDRTATGTSEGGFDFLLEKGSRLMPELLAEEVTASYAGLRAAADRDDYLIEADTEQRYLLVGGIRSTGLTSSLAVAEHVRELLGEAGLSLVPRPDLPDPPQMPNLGEAGRRPYQDEEKISADPAYGRIVCFCERVTAGEIRDAVRSVLPPAGLDGLRRRTRALNGRCQGFYCAAAVGAEFDRFRADRRAPEGDRDE